MKNLLSAGLKGPAHESQDSSMGAQLPLQDSHTSSFPSSSCPCESMQPPTAGPADVPSEDLNFGQSLLAGIWPETSVNVSSLGLLLCQEYELFYRR